METREAKSECNIIPRGNNVLIKMCFKTHVLDLSTGKASKESDGEKVKFYVAGVGPLVPSDLNIGDEVNMTIQPYENVIVKGNDKSLELLRDYFSPKNMKPDELQTWLKNTPKVDTVQYGLFPEFIAKGIIR